MIVRIALAAAAILAVSPVAARAVDYRVMGEDERAISVIEGAIKTDSDGHKETVFYIGFAEPVSGPGGTQVVSATILFDCTASKYKVGASTTFKADMTLVERGTTHYGWRDLVVDSPFSRAAAYACRSGDMPRADSPEMKGIVAGYLARRAAAVPPAPAPTPEPEPTPEPAPASETPAEPSS